MMNNRTRMKIDGVFVVNENPASQINSMEKSMMYENAFYFLAITVCVFGILMKFRKFRRSFKFVYALIH